MWIRRKDKKELIKCNDIYIDGNYVCSLENKNVSVLGKYSTEEKAMKVLDDIQRRLFVIEQVKTIGFETVIDCLFIQSVDKSKSILRLQILNDIDIFQMPLDEEVEIS